MKKYFTRIVFVVAVFLFGAKQSDAQGFLRVGYNLGFANPKEVNRVIYIHNQINSNYYATGKELKPINTIGGLHIEAGSEGDGGGWYMSWSNRHHVSESKFEYLGETIHRQLKVRSNMFSFGFYGGSSNFSVGLSIDVGNFKGFYKRAPADSVKSADYIPCFQNKLLYGGVSDEPEHGMLSTTQMGFTPFVQLRVGPVGARFFYQWQMINLGIDNLDNKLLGADIEQDNQLQDKMNNYGVMLFFQIGGSK